jgi:hypothetical protein
MQSWKYDTMKSWKRKKAKSPLEERKMNKLRSPGPEWYILGEKRFWTDTKVPGHPEAKVSVHFNEAGFGYDKCLVVIAEPARQHEGWWNRLLWFEKMVEVGEYGLYENMAERILQEAVDLLVETEIRKLKEVLSALVDEQNGPPVEKRRVKWFKAMSAAMVALNRPMTAWYHKMREFQESSNEVTG